METGALIPLAFFALGVLIVAITTLTKLHDKEMEVHQSLHLEELEHNRRMKELEADLERVKKANRE